MVKGSIKLVIQSDAKQAEKDLQALEKSAQRIKNLEKENAALGKSYDQMRAKAEKAAQATLEAASKAATVDKQAEAYASSVRDKYDFGLPPKEVDYLAGQELSGDEKYKKLAQAAQEAADKHQQLSAAQKEAEKSAADLKRQIAENTQQLTAERAALTEHQEKTQKSAASTQKLNEKLRQTAKSGKKASAGLLGVEKSSRSASRGTLNLGLALKSMLLYMGVSKAIEAMKAGFADLAQASSSFNGTMSGLSSSFLQVRNSIAAACAPALQALTPIIQTVANAFVTAMNAIGAFSARLFGNATTFTRAKYAAVDYAKSVADTAKTAKDADKEMGSLASFDQVNNIQKQETGAATAANNGKPAPQDMFETVGISEGTIGLVDKIKNAFTHMWDTLAPSFQAAAQKFEKPFARFKQSIFEFVARMQTLRNPLMDWFGGDFTTFLKQSIDTISTILAGLFDSFSLVFGDVLNLVLYPFLETFTVTILPTITQAATEFMSALSVLFTEIKRIFDQLWTEGVRPALELIMTIWNDLWSSIQQAWLNWGKPIFDGVKEAFRNTANIIQNVWETILKPVWDTFMETLDWLWKEHLKPLVDEFLDFCGTLADGALQIYNKFISPIVNWFVNVFGPPIRNAFQMVVSVIGSVIGTVVDAAKGIIKALKGVVNFIVGVFTGDWKKAWDGIKQAFQGVVDGIKVIFKGAVNVIIDLINTMLRAMTTGINTVIRGVNKMSFTVPDWVLGIGGKTFGFNIKEIKEYQIPKLATGAVIPPNREFAAILGDQRHGRNLEAPEGLIRQIVREELGNVYNPVLNAINNSNLGKKATIMGDVYMDSQKVGRVVARPVFKEGNRAGYIKVKV